MQLIASASNLFHRAMLITVYSTGMRRAEMCNLKVEDLDSDRMVIHIRQGKGQRDRDVPLSPKLLDTLREYWRWMKPKMYLFPGMVKGIRADKPITAKVVWEACREAAQRAGIGKAVAPHLLRHSFATHLVEGGARICRPCSYYSGIPTSSPLPSTCTCLSAMQGSGHAAGQHGIGEFGSGKALAQTEQEMKPPPFEVADIIRAHGNSFVDRKRSWHCPKCQTNAREKWLAARKEELLPVKYVHVVFTIPHELSWLALHNKKLVYDLLFHASAATLLEVAADPRHLGADIGFLSVLHTGDRTSRFIRTYTA